MNDGIDEKFDLEKFIKLIRYVIKEPHSKEHQILAFNYARRIATEFQTLENINRENKNEIEKWKREAKTQKEYVYLMHDRLGPLCNKSNRLWLDNKKLEKEIEELNKKIKIYENNYNSG